MIENCRTKSLWLIMFMSVLIMLSPNISSADDNNFYIGVTGQGTPFLTGNADKQLDTMYKDAFGVGWGVGVEGGYRFAEFFSVQVGVGYEKYVGSTFEGRTFDDLNIIPIYGGGKFHILTNKFLLDPYIRLDLGAARLNSVESTYNGLKYKNWNDSWTFLLDAGAGLEVHLEPVGLFIEVKGRYLGSPDALSSLGDADSSWTLPINLGVRYYF
ncbi:MAG: outer membrane beta-barrel protein [Deltaproteobacteria bacterium]|nr:outer membrane beta-barrel protein [Deltaproteobacteria bacterium]